MYHTADPVMIDLNRHERAQDAGVERAENIERRARELLKPGHDCYPFDADNVQVALAELETIELADALQTGDDAFIGVTLKTMLRAFWIEQAANQARREARNAETPVLFF